MTDVIFTEGFETETLDKLYLEWSQFTKAKTGKELDLIKCAAALYTAIDDVIKIIDPHRETPEINEAYHRAYGARLAVLNADVLKRVHVHD